MECIDYRRFEIISWFISGFNCNVIGKDNRFIHVKKAAQTGFCYGILNVQSAVKNASRFGFVCEQKKQYFFLKIQVSILVNGHRNGRIFCHFFCTRLFISLQLNCFVFCLQGSMAKQGVGRVFCVTGIQTRDQIRHNQSGKAASKGHVGFTTALVGQSDNESNTSGYLSSSSFESSGEERRLMLNEEKVFQVWDKWGERVRVHSGPKSSTPKQGSEAVVNRRRVNVSGDSSKSLLAIKKSLTEKCADAGTLEDSFWDIKVTRVQKSSSEGDVRASHMKQADNSWKRRGVAFADVHDAGSDINFSRHRTNSQDWKRRPYLTQSTSHQDLRSHNSSNGSHRNSGDYSNYSALPRYRVKVDADTNLVTQMCKSCADFADEGKPVDESMSEFLGNVDKENLASFLNFYDRVTNSSDYERARRNPKNYESVFF